MNEGSCSKTMAPFYFSYISVHRILVMNEKILVLLFAVDK